MTISHSFPSFLPSFFLSLSFFLSFQNMNFIFLFLYFWNNKKYFTKHKIYRNFQTSHTKWSQAFSWRKDSTLDRKVNVISEGCDVRLMFPFNEWIEKLYWFQDNLYRKVISQTVELRHSLHFVSFQIYCKCIAILRSCIVYTPKREN